jgi:hypothetical protein
VPSVIIERWPDHQTKIDPYVNRKNSTPASLMQIKYPCSVLGNLPLQIWKCSENLSVSGEKGRLRHPGKAFGPGDVLLSHRDIYALKIVARGADKEDVASAA